MTLVGQQADFAPTSLPNILLVLCDQMVPFLTGAYGHPVVRTPALSRLAKKGVVFRAAYTNYPVCAPARASLLTGKYGAQTQCYDNAAMFPSDMPTIAHHLAAAGYDTVLSGKMHFIGPDQLHGFAKRLTTDIYPSDMSWLPTQEESGTFLQPGGQRPIAADYVTAGVRQWSFGLEFDEETHFRALEYLRSRRTDLGGSEQFATRSRSASPFFLCVSYHHPHEPFHVTPEMWTWYDDAEIEVPVMPHKRNGSDFIMDRWVDLFHGVDSVVLNGENLRRLRRSYYTLVSYVDKKVSELLECLASTGLEENTLVIFASDHGDMLGERGMVQKRSFYEWASRIPLIVAMPSSWGPEWSRGVESPELVSLIDVLPTICEVAGTSMPATAEGVSMVDLLRGRGSLDRTHLFGEYYSEGVYAPCFMVRRSDGFKWVCVYGREERIFRIEKVNGHLEEDSPVPSDVAASISGECKEALLRQFSPSDILRDVQHSIERRRILKAAGQVSGTRWDYSPVFPAESRYVRFY